MVMSRKENKKNLRKRKRKTTILKATSVILISYLILHLFSYTIWIKESQLSLRYLIFNRVHFSIFNSQNFLYFFQMNLPSSYMERNYMANLSSYGSISC